MNEKKEIWKPIKGYESLYLVSNCGRVKSLGRTIIMKNGKTRIFPEKIIKPQINIDHYLIGLWRDNKVKRMYLHRLVAEAFIPNPKCLPLINHKDENPANNNVENLEWCDARYNTFYGTSYERSRVKRQKQVAQYTKDMRLVKIYPSVIIAAKETGIVRNDISACCHNRLKSAGGYKWLFLQKKFGEIENNL